MNNKLYSMEEILRALDVSGIKLVSTRKKFFDALISEEKKITEEEQQIIRCLSDGY